MFIATFSRQLASETSVIDRNEKARIICDDTQPGFHVGTGEHDRSIRLWFDDLEPAVVRGFLQLDFPRKVHDEFTACR